MKKLFLFLFPFALQAQPLTLNDPAMLDWPKQFVGGCTVSNCPVEFWSVLTNWWQHTCGTVYSDEFTGFYGGDTRTGAQGQSGWEFSTRTNMGFWGEGFNLAPYYCRTAPTMVDVRLTNLQAAVFYIVCSNFAAVEPSGIVRVERNSPWFQWGDKTEADWTNGTANIGTNFYTQADLTAGAVIGWTGGDGMTNAQFIANKHGAVYLEFRKSGSGREEQYIWNGAEWEFVMGSDSAMAVDSVQHANELTNWVEVAGETNYTEGGSYLSMPMEVNPCFSLLNTLDCGNAAWSSAAGCTLWVLRLNGSVSTLETGWRYWATNGGYGDGNWILTNYVQVSEPHSLTNWISGGTGGWRTNFNNGTAMWRTRSSWNIYVAIANSYLYFDSVKFATNTICD